MTTKIISVKAWRQNLSKIWKEAKGKNIRFIVMNHSKPMFEVKPIYEDELVLEGDWSKEEHYQAAEQSLKFWSDKADDNLFDENVSL